MTGSVCSEKVVVNYRSLPFRGRLEGYILNEGKLQKLYEKTFKKDAFNLFLNIHY